MGTYNTYLNRKLKAGNEIPVWLGFVQRIPAGGKLNSDYAKAGAFIPAGTPMELKDGVITPFNGFVVTAVTTQSTNTIITVKPIYGGIKPATTDFLMKVGATFATTGKAWNPDSVAVNATDAEAYDITVATANIDAVVVGDVLAYSSATAEGGSKALAIQPTHYLFNDIAIDNAETNEEMENIYASGALVNSHAAGILINRTPAGPVAKQMLAAVPNVIQDARF